VAWWGGTPKRGPLKAALCTGKKRFNKGGWKGEQRGEKGKARGDKQGLKRGENNKCL